MAHDHFQPELVLSMLEQKKLRSHLEQIDIAAFEANKQVLSKSVGRVDLNSFRKLATSAASRVRTGSLLPQRLLIRRERPPSRK